MIYRLALLLLSFLAIESAAAQDVYVPDRPGEFIGDAPGANAVDLQRLKESGLLQTFDIPGQTNNFAEGELKVWKAKAIAAHKNLTLTPDVAVGKAYDLVLQVGHYARKKGVTGGEGIYVNEQQIGAWVGQMIYDNLTAAGVSVALIPADDYPKPLTAKIFLSLHTDSADPACAVLPSVGYDGDSDALGMHFIAAALAHSLDIDVDDFMADAYTRGLRSYYAFKDMNVSMFEGVLEMSELSCDWQEDKLLGNAELLARNLARAVKFALKPVAK